MFSKQVETYDAILREEALDEVTQILEVLDKADIICNGIVHDLLASYKEALEDAILQDCKEKLVRIEDRYKQNRIKMPSHFILPILSAECVSVIKIDGVRNIVWRYQGTLYLQECLKDGSRFYATK